MPSLEGLHQPGLRRAGDAGDTGLLPVNSVDNTELALVPANTMKGNPTGALANVSDMTVAQIIALLGIGTAGLQASTAFDAAGLAAAAQAASQPLDSDLTAIAALATTAYGRALLALANQAALVALLPSYQPLDSDLTAIAALTTTAYGQALLTLANQAALVALLPNSGNTAGRFRNEVLIDRKVITGTSFMPYVCPAWAAGLYQEIIIRWKGKLTADTEIRLQMNNDAGLNYTHTYYTVNNSVAGGTSPPATLGYAVIAQMSYATLAGFTAEFEMKFNPLTDGNYRLGRGFGYYACPDASGWGMNESWRSIGYTNNAADITYFTLAMQNAGTGLLGPLTVWGVPA